MACASLGLHFFIYIGLWIWHACTFFSIFSFFFPFLEIQKHPKRLSCHLGKKLPNLYHQRPLTGNAIYMEIGNRCTLFVMSSCGTKKDFLNGSCSLDLHFFYLHSTYKKIKYSLYPIISFKCTPVSRL